MPCRDCGNMIDPKSRGCSSCALNLEAESMIERFVFRLFVSIVTILAIGAGIFFYLHRS